MQPPLKHKGKLTCLSKRRYPDELTAHAAGAYSKEASGFVGALFVYQCTYCRGYHLTKHPGSNQSLGYPPS